VIPLDLDDALLRGPARPAAALEIARERQQLVFGKGNPRDGGDGLAAPALDLAPNPHDAVAAIRRATEPAVEQLAEEELRLALEQRFAIELELGLAADALETYERRAELGRWSTRDPVARVGAELERTLESPETSLAEKGRLSGDGRWEHSMTWPTFAIGDANGPIEGLELECNRSKEALPFEEDVQMTVPAGWGGCALLVRGQPGTEFVLYQLKEPAG